MPYHINMPLWRFLLAVTLLMGMLAAPAMGQEQTTPTLSREQLLQQAKDRAIQQILTASHSENPFLRANAIEAMQPLPRRAMPLAQLGLDDKSPAVRFVALVTIGKLQFKTVGQAARRLLDDPSSSVRAAAMFAAHETGQKVNISNMASMLASTNPRLRANVAMLLGMMGDRSAVPMIQSVAKTPMGHHASPVQQVLTRLQVSEALAQLGDNAAFDAIRAAAYSNHDEARVLAVTIMGKLKDRRMIPAIRQLLADPPIELQLAAAGALARMGEPQGLTTVLKGAQFDKPPVRAQAAFVLGLMPDPQAADELVKMLDDESEQVRLAAAAAIVKAGARQ